MLVRGLMGSQSTAPSLSQEAQPLLSVKPLRASTILAFRQVAQAQPRRQSLAPRRLLKETKAVSQTTAAQRGQSKKQKPAQTVK
jgi:hypothetical protein